MNDADEVLAGFTRALAAAGVAVTADRTQTYLDAVSRVGADSRESVYWAGRSTLCASPDDFAAYDKTFESWFSAEPPPRPGPAREPRTVAQADLSSGESETGGDEHSLSVLASAEEVLRSRDVAQLAPGERQLVNRMFARLDPRPPTRRSARRRPVSRGEIDPARTVRDQLRRAGEPGPLRYRRRRVRPRRTVWLIDVSGSMEPYADSLLRLAHRATTAAAPRDTEVFTLGTRLTRVTPAMRLRDPEQALTAAGNAVPDWSGGTRLGDVLRAFVDRWGQRGMARSSVVVVCSDGWERGDPVLLAAQVERLSRLSYRLIWANPHRGKAGYEPVQGGIAAALPYLDALVAGHSMHSFERLLQVICEP